VSVLTPFHPDSWSDVTGTRWLDLLADEIEEFGGERPPWPEPGGVLRFADHETRLSFWWQTGGHPDEWTVLVEATGDWYPLPLTATGLLAQVVRGDLYAGWATVADGEEDEEIAERWFYSWPADRVSTLGPHVVVSHGYSEGEHLVRLDLGGALGRPRAVVLEEFLASAPADVRSAIRAAKARRSEELLFLHGPEQMQLVIDAVQAFAELRWRPPARRGSA
jgi:hypothetical protein